MENMPVGNELALRRRTYEVLDKLDNEKLKEQEESSEDGFERTLSITTHLFTSLKTSLKHKNYGTSIQILKYLVEKRQCSKRFVWKMFNTYLQKDSAFFSSMLPEMINAVIDIKGFNHDEIRLVNTIHLLNQELYDRAHQEASKFEGKRLSNSLNDKACIQGTSVASSYLLATYKTILEHQLIEPDDLDSLTVMMHSFELLISKKAFLPLIADPYVTILMKLDLTKKAENFIKNYVDTESKGNMGITAATHALNIVKLHVPKASQKLITYLLEIIANRDPGHPRVLDLCQQLLYQHNPRTRTHSGTESNLDYDSDGIHNSHSSTSNNDSLKKCLEYIIYFLDTHINHEPTSVIRNGWSIFADIMRRICLQATDGCLKTIVKLYHRDRKKWWPYFHYHPPDSLPPGESAFFSNQGTVCFLLESETHPFVDKLMKLNESSLLKSLVKQLRSSKKKLDSRIQIILKNDVFVTSLPPKPLVLEPLPTVTQMHVFQETPGLSRFQSIDSEKVAQEFADYISRSRPIKDKTQYGSTATRRSTTENILPLPVTEMLAERYKYRRTVAPRTSSRSSGRLSSNSQQHSSCSLNSGSEREKSDSFQDGQPQQTRPWVNRLRSSKCLAHEETSDSLLSDSDLRDTENLQRSMILADSVVNKIDRWKEFIDNGNWQTLKQDGASSKTYDEISSSDEYDPECSNDEESDSDSGESLMSQSEMSVNILPDEPLIQARQPMSIASSYPSLSPASSVSSIFTPMLPLTNICSHQKEVIPNEGRYPFLDFDGFSECGSTASEVVLTVTQVLEKLENESFLSGQKSESNKDATDLVCGTNLVEVSESALEPSVSGFNQTSVVPETILRAADSVMDPSRFEFATDEEYVVEADIELPSKSSISFCRSFSRDFEASSPDMFVSFSSGEGSDNDVAKCVAETQLPVGVDVGENGAAEKCDNLADVSLKQTQSIIFSPKISSTFVGREQPDKSDTSSKMSLSNNDTRTSTNEEVQQSTSKIIQRRNRSMSSKKTTKRKKRRRVSELDNWNVELVERLIKEAKDKESSSVIEKSPVTVSKPSPITNKPEVISNLPGTTQMLPDSTVQEPEEVIINMPSTSSVLSSVWKEAVIETSKVSNSCDSSALKSIVTNQSSLGMSTSRKCHVRQRDLNYWSDEEHDTCHDELVGLTDTVKGPPQNERRSSSLLSRKLNRPNPCQQSSGNESTAPVLEIPKLMKSKIKTHTTKGKSLKSAAVTPLIGISSLNSESETETETPKLKESKIKTPTTKGKSLKSTAATPLIGTSSLNSESDTGAVKSSKNKTETPTMKGKSLKSAAVTPLIGITPLNSEYGTETPQLKKSKLKTPTTKGKSLKPAAVTPRINVPSADSESEAESTDELIQRILAEAEASKSLDSNSYQIDKPRKKQDKAKKSLATNFNKTDKKKRQSSNKVASLVNEPITEEVDVGRSIEDVLRKYLGSDSEDDDKKKKPKKAVKEEKKGETDKMSVALTSTNKSKDTKDLTKRISEGNPRVCSRKSLSSDKSVKKSSSTRRSLIDQRNIELIDRLLREKGEEVSSPDPSPSPTPSTTTTTKKPSKRRHSVESKKSMKKPSLKRKKTS